jgi:OOP family OmpA-OmpF porin
MNIKLAALVSATLASSIALAPMSASAGYLTDSSGVVVKSGAGECWQGIWPNPDKLEACGDMMQMAVADSDGDGVPDADDKCPGTLKGIIVDATGCPADSDGDGVVDSYDKCPNTPKGAKVNKEGCEIIGDVTINLVNDEFDFDSANLKPEMKTALDEVAAKVKATKGEEALSVVGHTDSTGPEAYNQILSERRANAVADYLSGQGVDRGAMTVSGKGESSPVADNGTKAGRKMNRRVEIMSK